MKKIIYILILFTGCLIQAQKYTFDTIDKRTFSPGWEILQIPGTVTINDTSVIFSTKFNELVLKINSKQRFIRHDDLIFSCQNNDVKVNIRMFCDDQLRKHFELYYYSEQINGKYFRFCLTKTN